MRREASKQASTSKAVASYRTPNERTTENRIVVDDPLR